MDADEDCTSQRNGRLHRVLATMNRSLVFLAVMVPLALLPAVALTRFKRERRDADSQEPSTETVPPLYSTPGAKMLLKSNESRSSKLSREFNSLLEVYDRRFRPAFRERPVDITLDAHVLTFSNINEANMEFTVDLYFGQLWTEPRLAAPHLTENDSILLIGKEAEALWLPDTIFINSKSSSLNRGTMDNRFLTVYLQTGLCVYHTRISLNVACQMDLRRYPFDTQTCYLAIESHGHDNLDVTYKWREDEHCSPNCSHIFVYDKEMSKFDLIRAEKSSKRTRYHTDNFAWATTIFSFRRRSQFFIPRVYTPCILIVIVSFTTFWISKEAVPARASICITAILTLITMLGVVNARMPEVSYMKSLDVYLLVSFVFVFCALLEYIAVLNSHLFKAGRRTPLYEGSYRFHHQNGSSKGKDLESDIQHERESNEHDPLSHYRHRKNNPRRRQESIERGYEHPFHDFNICHTPTSRIDFIARIAFPLLYGTLNLAYWIISLSYSENEEI